MYYAGVEDSGRYIHTVHGPCSWQRSGPHPLVRAAVLSLDDETIYWLPGNR